VNWYDYTVFNKIAVNDATLSGSALPPPLVPSREITGAYEVWFFTSSLQANPEGDREVALIISDGWTKIMRVLVL
jgi:hypothetical protein